MEVGPRSTVPSYPTMTLLRNRPSLLPLYRKGPTGISRIPKNSGEFPGPILSLSFSLGSKLGWWEVSRERLAGLQAEHH